MKVFLTGASGFIGARLAECLSGAYGWEVSAFLRRYGTVGAARLARLKGVSMHFGDVRDPRAVERAAKDCDYVVHCATGVSGSRREQEEATVGGTRHVLEAAARQGARRVVHFSSASVQDPAGRTGLIREEDPLEASFPYARMKMDAEAVAAEYAGRGVPAVILRPTCVWGPFSPNWTIGAVELIRRGVPILPFEGRGAANAVYIDNLVDAVALALTRPEAPGQTFCVNDDGPAAWGELYGGYARCLGVPLRYLSEPPGPWEMLRVSAVNAWRLAGEAVSGRVRGIGVLRQGYDHIPAVKLALARFPEEARARLKRFASEREAAGRPYSDPAVPGAAGSPGAAGAGRYLEYHFVSKPMLELYGARARYSNEKIKRLLGWRPRVPLGEGLERTCRWLG